MNAELFYGNVVKCNRFEDRDADERTILKRILLNGRSCY